MLFNAFHQLGSVLAGENRYVVLSDLIDDDLNRAIEQAPWYCGWTILQAKYIIACVANVGSREEVLLIVEQSKRLPARATLGTVS